MQTGALGDVEDARSLSGEGSVVSIAMLLSAVGVLVLAVSLFLIEVIVRNAKEFYEAQQRAKWAGCTVDPPTTSWSGESPVCRLWSPLMLQKPLLMDPVNPFTNVADPQAHLRRQLQPFAYGTRVRERELERVQFARLETNDLSS